MPVIADNRGVLRRDARETGGANAPMPPRIGGNTRFVFDGIVPTADHPTGMLARLTVLSIAGRCPAIAVPSG